jgi:hypothetical protein
MAAALPVFTIRKASAVLAWVISRDLGLLVVSFWVIVTGTLFEELAAVKAEAPVKLLSPAMV